MEEEEASLMTWVCLIVVAIASFWCQAIVTEERLVPALNVIAEYYSIPNDIAGATLMAGGASSPELFSSFVSLFVTHSSLGLGTIVGSLIFNELIICAGAVYASKNGKLQLERSVVTREVGFYALSLLLLYLALDNIKPVEGDDKDRIFISFWDACLVFNGYIVYVLVCGNMKAVVAGCNYICQRLAGYKKKYYIEGENNELVSDEEDLLPTKFEEVTNGEQDELDSNHDHISLVQCPKDSSKLQLLSWIFLFPLRYVLHCTLPDVRTKEKSANETTLVRFAYLSTFMCLVWLILASYTMVSSLEALALLLNVPDSVLGATICAAGTSLPNYIASRIAAEKGLGDQAVSNAFGSNIFCILVGLGLPWTLYTSIGTGFQPYSDLRNDDIIESILLMAAVLLVFVILVFPTGFVLYRWHGTLFIAMYMGYLTLVLYQNWTWDTNLISDYITW